jgi:hypothetical protein
MFVMAILPRVKRENAFAPRPVIRFTPADHRP